MDLSDEAASLIAANGRGLQSENTRCHFCGQKGRHLFVLVEQKLPAGEQGAPERKQRLPERKQRLPEREQRSPEREQGEELRPSQSWRGETSQQARPPESEQEAAYVRYHLLCRSADRLRESRCIAGMLADTPMAAFAVAQHLSEQASAGWPEERLRAAQRQGDLAEDRAAEAAPETSEGDDLAAEVAIAPALGVVSLGDGVGRAFALGGARVRGEYRGRCEHIDWDGSPWCDSCVMLGRGADGTVRPCCPECCGIWWGVPAPEATPEQEERRVLWTPEYEAVWASGQGLGARS